MKGFLSLLLLGFSLSVVAQKGGLDFSLLRQNDDISSLKGKKDKSFYERLKLIELSPNSELSFGGSYRSQIEAFVNEQFSTATDQNDYWNLNRFMLHSHLKIANRFEFYAEINSSLINSKEDLTPVDRDDLAINQLYVEYHLDSIWKLSAGRKNMRLGSGRLIDIREGPNVRLSFDMAEINYFTQKNQLKIFAGVPVRQGPEVFDNESLDFQEWVSGVYWTHKLPKRNKIDIYALFKSEEQKLWDSGLADDERASLGLRHFGKWKQYNFNNEFVYQTGSFGSEDIRAWTASFNIERALKWKEFEYTLGIKSELISGDGSATDGNLNTFDGLYPRGAYFGRVARFGPSNLFDIHPYIDFKLGKLSVELDYVAFWRYSINDGLYNPALILDYPSVNENRFIAHQIGTITGMELNQHIALELETNLIFPGEFLIESGLNNTLFHTVATAEFKF